ncbi:MAG: hypothetical protein QOE97_3806 [Pseudonocardiales bacterium]|nr:hypothetical protein [Pseudonocardiales bacterium]
MTTVYGSSGVTAHGSPRALLEQARLVLADAARAGTAGERFSMAHLAALRTAAALFAERGRPAAARRRLVSAWALLEAVAPELREWAVYFAAGASARAAVDAGALSAVTDRDADDQLRAAEQFLGIVETSVGLLTAPLAS